MQYSGWHKETKIERISLKDNELLSEKLEMGKAVTFVKKILRYTASLLIGYSSLLILSSFPSPEMVLKFVIFFPF